MLVDLYDETESSSKLGKAAATSRESPVGRRYPRRAKRVGKEPVAEAAQEAPVRTRRPGAGAWIAKGRQRRRPILKLPWILYSTGAQLSTYRRAASSSLPCGSGANWSCDCCPGSPTRAAHLCDSALTSGTRS